MEDEEFETVWLETSAPLSRKFYKVDLLVLGLNFMRGVAQAAAETLETAVDIAAMHANWQIDREAFHEEAALEIETLIAGEDE